MPTTIATKQDILDALHQNQSRLRSLGVKRMGVFGSFVRGQQRPESDIDLLVEFERDEKTFDRFMELSFFLEDILQHRIELVTTESLSPYLAPHILKEVEYAALAA
jgi:predicted nucleotidyltransferase